MLTLGAVASVIPPAFRTAAGATAEGLGRLSVSLSVVLLAASIAIASSVQVALFVAPVLVLASYALGPMPMYLAFPASLVLVILPAVLITRQVSGDGRSDWRKGIQLLTVYLSLALTFFFFPVASSH